MTLFSASKVILIREHVYYAIGQRRRSNARCRWNVHDVDETLATVIVAVLGKIVAQPNAGELARRAIAPRDGERDGLRRDGGGNDGRVHGTDSLDVSISPALGLAAGYTAQLCLQAGR